MSNVLLILSCTAGAKVGDYRKNAVSWPLFYRILGDRVKYAAVDLDRWEKYKTKVPNRWKYWEFF